MARKRRRAHGEGSVYQRRNGVWCASIDIGYVNGKRRRQVVYGKTEKDVIARRKELHLQQELGVDLGTNRTTVAQLCHAWLDMVVKPNRRVRTYESYADMVSRHILPSIGHHRVRTLRPQDAQKLITMLSEAGLAPRTIQYIRAILRRALYQAIRWGYVSRNVATMVDVPRVEKYKVEPLTLEQTRSLLDHVKGHRLEALYRLALSLGLRRGEVLGLHWHHIDLEQRLMRIEVSLQRGKKGLEFSPTKSDASCRTLPLPDVLVAALKQHQERQNNERHHRGDAWQEHELVFPSQVGTPLEPRNLNRHFKSVLKAVGLPDTIRFHDLRHSCATFLIVQGVHIRVVMEILGHSQISLTMDTYGHVFPETQRQAIESIEALFATQPGDMPPADGTDQTSESLGHQSDQAADAPDLQQLVKEIEQYVMSGQSRLDVEETFSLRETRALVDLLSRMTRIVS